MYIKEYNHLLSYDMQGTIIIWDISTQSQKFNLTVHNNTLVNKLGVNNVYFDFS